MSGRRIASTLALVLALAAGGAALVPAAEAAATQAAAAAAPRVEALVVGRTGWTVGPRTVSVGPVRVGRCRVGAGLPVGVLAALHLPFTIKGSCGSGLYVSSVRGERERGAAGWVYKVGRRVPGRSAGDPAGRLRSGQRVIWFWCHRAGRCQRTLETTARSAGGRLRVVVTGYDDFGRGRRVAGATVLVRRVGSSRRTVHRTGRDGSVVIPAARGARYRIDSRRSGYVRGFPTEVRAR
jgi:hypothetical protein